MKKSVAKSEIKGEFPPPHHPQIYGDFPTLNLSSILGNSFLMRRTGKLCGDWPGPGEKGTQRERPRRKELTCWEIPRTFFSSSQQNPFLASLDRRRLEERRSGPRCLTEFRREVPGLRERIKLTPSSPFPLKRLFAKPSPPPCSNTG